MFFARTRKRRYTCRKSVTFEDQNGNMKTIVSNFHHYYTKREAAAQSMFDESDVKRDGSSNNIHRINDLSFEYDNYEDDENHEHVLMEYIIAK